MDNSQEQGRENISGNSIRPLETTSEKNLQVLTMEHADMIDECIQGPEIENGNGTCSKETLFLVGNEEVSMAMAANCKHHTENLICDLHELLAKASSRTFNRLTDEYANEENNVNDDNTNQKIHAEDIAPRNIINRIQSNRSVYTGRAKKNNTDILSCDPNEQQNKALETANKAVSPVTGIKRANTNTCATKKLTKRAKTCPPTISKSKTVNEENVKLTSTFSTEFKFNTNSTLQCMDSLISRRRTIYKKKQEAREKLARMENETLSNIRKQKKRKVKRSPRTKKLNPKISSVYFDNPDSNVQCMESLIKRRRFNFNKKQEDLKKCEQDKSIVNINKRKVKKDRRGQHSKNLNNDTIHNEDNKKHSPRESDETYSPCIYCNKYHDFYHCNKCLSKQHTAKIPNEKRKSSWCIIL